MSYVTGHFTQPNVPLNTQAESSDGHLLLNSVNTQISESIASLSESTAETLEDIGLAIGSRLRNEDKGDKKTKDNPAATLARIAKSIPMDGNTERLFSQLETALSEFSNPAELMRFLTHLFHDSATVALIIQLYLQRKKKFESRLSPILSALLEDLGEDSSVLLFSALHFGAGNREIKQQINRLYHETARTFQGIVGFYKTLKKRIHRHKDRKKAVVCLMHSYSEDIHDESEGLFKIKIAHVIQELKRLFTVLSMDDNCVDIAEFLNRLPEVDNLAADQIISATLEWLDTIWIYEEMVQEKLIELPIKTLTARILFLQHMLDLFKHLPELCFEDEENRTHIIKILQQVINTAAHEEDSNTLW